MVAIESLERQLRVASNNNTALQRQQTQLMESVHTLINMVATTTGTCTQTLHFSCSAFTFIQTSLFYGVAAPPRSHMWRNCADAYKAGHSVSGLYHIYTGNRTEPVQVTNVSAATFVQQTDGLRIVRSSEALKEFTSVIFDGSVSLKQLFQS